MPNGNFSECIFHIFLKAETDGVIILCKLYIVILYLYTMLARVKMWGETKLCSAIRFRKGEVSQCEDGRDARWIFS